MVEASEAGGRSWVALGGDGWLVSTPDGAMVLKGREAVGRRADVPHGGWTLFHTAVEVGPRLWRVDWEPDLPSAALRATAGGRRVTEVWACGPVAGPGDGPSRPVGPSMCASPFGDGRAPSRDPSPDARRADHGAPGRSGEDLARTHRTPRTPPVADDVAMSLGGGVWIVATRRCVLLLRPGRAPQAIPPGSVASWSAILGPHLHRRRKARGLRP